MSTPPHHGAVIPSATVVPLPRTTISEHAIRSEWSHVEPLVRIHRKTGTTAEQARQGFAYALAP